MLRRFRCNYRGCLIVFNVLKAAWLRHFPCCAYIDGAVVTVAAATGTAINVAFTLTMETGVAYSAISEQVKAALQAYYDGLIASWADAEALVVRVSQIESRILDVPGVVDIMGTTINSSTGNLVLSSVAIPIMGTVVNNAS